MTNLSVNLNAVAYLRNRRDLPWPSVTALGRIALEAGARGLTVHPRPDQRHIRRADVPALAAMIRQYFPDCEFNIEGYPDEDFLDLVTAILPDQVTLVPDDPGQATSDHGWNVKKNAVLLKNVIRRLTGERIRVSVFIDASPAAAKEAAKLGADRVELYTGPYGAAHDDAARAKKELGRLARAAKAARDAGLKVNAGHDLTVANLPALIARAPFIAEVSIGHGITAEALEHGMAGAVRRFRAALGQG